MVAGKSIRVRKEFCSRGVFHSVARPWESMPRRGKAGHGDAESGRRGGWRVPVPRHPNVITRAQVMDGGGPLPPDGGGQVARRQLRGGQAIYFRAISDFDAGFWPCAQGSTFDSVSPSEKRVRRVIPGRIFFTEVSGFPSASVVMVKPRTKVASGLREARMPEKRSSFA